MNKRDSDAVAAQLVAKGYSMASDPLKADVVLLNTCSVRDSAEQKAIGKMSHVASQLKSRNKKAVLGFMGCMAQSRGKELIDKLPDVDLVIGTQKFHRAADHIGEALSGRAAAVVDIEEEEGSEATIREHLLDGVGVNKSITSFVSIMQGCNQFCTFCIVPFTRGRERSRPIESIVNEIQDGVSHGFVEFTLLGQNVNSYSTPNGKFPELLDRVASIDGVKRLRFSSPHPQDVDDEMLEVMSSYDNICNHVHLPLQSGNDRILNRMNRSYTSNDFLSLSDKIREYMPGCSITTDVIVGFPGETEEEFEDTLNVARKVGFNFAFMFKYSSRPGTKASEYTDQIPEAIKQNRLERLIDVQLKNTLKQNQNLIGETIKVLVEKESKKSKDQWAGRTEGNMWVVFDKGNESIGDLIDVKIEDARGVTLFGTNTNREYRYEVA